MKIFYGWWIVAVSMLLVFLDGGIGFYSYGVFYVPFEKEFGWGRADVALGMSVYNLTYGTIGFFAGRLTDSHGPKTIMVIGIITLGISYTLRSFITDLWQLYVLMAIMGAGVAALGAIPVAAAISKWFVKNRGLATGVTMTGIGFGGLTMVPLAQYLITALGWRTTTVIIGVAASLVVLPLVLLFMRAKPSDLGLLPDGAKLYSATTTTLDRQETDLPLPGSHPPGHGESSKLQSANWSLAESFRTPAFWFITTLFLLQSLASGAVLSHEVPYLVNIGIDAQAAAAALGLTAGIGIIGKLTSGVLSDRLGSRSVLALLLALQGIGVVILMGTSEMVMVWVFVAVFGFGMGGTVTVRPTIVAEVFGAKSLGAIFGLLAGFATVGGSIGPFVTGIVFDITRSYQLAMLALAVAYLVSTALVFFVRSPAKKAVPESQQATIGT